MVDFIKVSVIALFFLLLGAKSSAAQEFTSKNRRAVKSYKSAIANFESRNYQQFLADINEAIAADNTFVEAYLLAMQAMVETGNLDGATSFGEKAFAINPTFFPHLASTLGNIYLKEGNYNMAITYYDYYVNNFPKYKAKVETQYAKAKFALALMARPVPFQPINMGDSINTAFDDYWPSISGDGNILVKTTNLPSDNKARPFQEDFFESVKLKNGGWSKSTLLEGQINTSINEGAQSLTADGKGMYFTRCTSECDIYYSRLENGTWGVPMRLPSPVNTSASEKQPSISSDGKYLYFTSNREGGYGGYDLYVAVRDDITGEWLEVKNLGATLNTPQNDVAPFIHFDNRTLYFASDGHPGMGNLDLFVSRKEKDGSWSVPINLGYPINTIGEEQGVVIAADGMTTFFASNRQGSRGLDIYTFEMPDSLRPTPTSYIKGRVVDAVTRKALAAEVVLANLKTSLVEFQSKTSEDDGTFFTSLPNDVGYALQVSKNGYLFNSQSFILDSTRTLQQPLTLQVELTPISVGGKAVLRNVYFDFNSAELKSESSFELNRLVKLLNQNSTLWIEVSGFTDNKGDSTYNQHLSTMRAKSVVEYLIKSGIDKNRLRFVGYGEQHPIETNSTEEGRALNRRTEFKVLYL